MDSLPVLTSNLEINQTNDLPKIDDVTADLLVNTKDGSFKVHKSIVKCCPYFAAMINGNWLETTSSVVTFDLYSYSSTKFIIEHLYQPKTRVDSDQNLKELLALGDMLGVTSLVELVCSTVVVKLCHNFHKPCKDCIEGVISSFQLSSTFFITDLQQKCLQWLTKYFTKTWNTKSFANLPDSLHQVCLESVKSSMSVENIIDVSLNCNQLQDLLPSVKWVAITRNLLNELSSSCIKFLQQHLQAVLTSAKFESLKRGDTWNLNRVESIFLEAIRNLPVEQACLSYLVLEEMTQKPSESNGEFQPDPAYVTLIGMLHKQVESRLVQRVGMATKCSAWTSLPSAKQTAILQMGFFDPIDKNTHLVKNTSNKPIFKPNHLHKNKSISNPNPLRPTRLSPTNRETAPSIGRSLSVRTSMTRRSSPSTNGVVTDRPSTNQPSSSSTRPSNSIRGRWISSAR